MTTNKTPTWISVKERMPEFEKDVLVTGEEGTYAVAWLSQESNGSTSWVTTDSNCFVNEIIAWMPIIEFNQPKEQEHETNRQL